MHLLLCPQTASGGSTTVADKLEADRGKGLAWPSLMPKASTLSRAYALDSSAGQFPSTLGPRRDIMACRCERQERELE